MVEISCIVQRSGLVCYGKVLRLSSLDFRSHFISSHSDTSPSSVAYEVIRDLSFQMTALAGKSNTSLRNLGSLPFYEGSKSCITCFVSVCVDRVIYFFRVSDD